MDTRRHTEAVGLSAADLAAVHELNAPVGCANALVRPGDVVAADADGVVVVPAGRVAEVAGAARRREEAEAGKRARFAAGELGLDMYAMRAPLEAAGLRYLD